MLIERLNKDLITAMKSKDKLALSVIRMTKAAVQRFELDKRRPASDEEVIDVVNKQIKSREDSITEFKKGNRNDLVDATQAEIDLLKTYMPTPLTESEVNAIVEDAIRSTNATSMKDLGSVMKIVTPQLKGKCDMSTVSITIKARLS